MPTYEYECTKCGHVSEMLQSITAKPKRLPDGPCPRCRERAPIRRLIGGGGAVLFKGSGFYQTDYRSEGYKKAEKAEKDSTAPASTTKDSSAAERAAPTATAKSTTKSKGAPAAD